MKNQSLQSLLSAFFILVLTFTTFAQSGGTYTIQQSVIAGGGGTSSSGSLFSVTGTVGQAAAGANSSGGTYSVQGGFWTFAPVGLFTISGQVTLNGSPLPGVTINLTAPTPGSTTTNASGAYTFTDLPAGGNYTVTPTLNGYIFNPSFSTFNDLGANQVANFTATQCSYSINPNGTNAPAAGVSGSVSVTATTGCPWTASTTDSWITVTGGTPGSGNGTVNYTVAANSGAQRTGTITIAGQNFLITQAGTTLTVSGTINYGTSSTPKTVAGVLLSAAGTPTTSNSSNASGNYTLSGLIAGNNYTVTPTFSGNINGISAFDATLVLRCVAAGTTGCTLTANQRAAADANGSNNLSAFDATLILRFVAAGTQTSNTGQVGNWKFILPSKQYQPLATSLSGENYDAILVGEVNGNWVQ